MYIVTRASQKKTETPVICFHYRRNNCKYFGKQQGKCKFSHPKKCNTYMTHGPKSHKNPKGCDQKQCSSYHPKLCHQSVKNKLCPREKCNYSHLRGTKRNSQRNEWKSAQDLKTPHEGNNGLSGLQTSVSNPPWSQAVTSGHESPFLERIFNTLDKLSVRIAQIEGQRREWPYLPSLSQRPMLSQMGDFSACT